MRKGLKIAGSTVFAAALSSCLFYCMVAGAKSGAVVYVVMAVVCYYFGNSVCRVSLYPPSSEAFEGAQ